MAALCSPSAKRSGLRDSEVLADIVEAVEPGTAEIEFLPILDAFRHLAPNPRQDERQHRKISVCRRPNHDRFARILGPFPDLLGDPERPKAVVADAVHDEDRMFHALVMFRALFGFRDVVHEQVRVCR